MVQTLLGYVSGQSMGGASIIVRHSFSAVFSLQKSTRFLTTTAIVSCVCVHACVRACMCREGKVFALCVCVCLKYIVIVLDWLLDYAGRVRVGEETGDGCVGRVVVHTPQLFHRLNPPSHRELSDTRLKYFIERVTCY